SPTSMTEGLTDQWIIINGLNFSDSISGFPKIWIDGIKLSGADSTGAAPVTYISSNQIKVQATEVYGGPDKTRDIAIRYNYGVNDKVDKSDMITVNVSKPTISNVMPSKIKIGRPENCWIIVNGIDFSESLSGYPKIYIDSIALKDQPENEATPAVFVNSNQIKVQVDQVYSGRDGQYDKMRRLAVRFNSGNDDVVWLDDAISVDIKPEITSISPNKLTIGQPENTWITINGADFVKELTDYPKVSIELTLLNGQGENNQAPVIFVNTNQIKVKVDEVFAGIDDQYIKDRKLIVQYASGNENSIEIESAISVEGTYYKNVSDWAQQSAQFMVENKIINDPTDHNLRGTVLTNRAELATMIYQALGNGYDDADDQFQTWAGREISHSPFVDVKDASVWYFKQVVYLSNLRFDDTITPFNCLDGSEAAFYPAGKITRGWALKAILEAWNIKPLDQSDINSDELFSDVPTEHPAAGYI
ncbi:S-layer domain-containing protein, partial [Candidatus Magnetomorum sp. HK-1]